MNSVSDNYIKQFKERQIYQLKPVYKKCEICKIKRNILIQETCPISHLKALEALELKKQGKV